MKSRWKIIARHKWVMGATITESYLDDPAVNLRRFTATIRGWRNWKMYEGVFISRPGRQSGRACP